MINVLDAGFMYGTWAVQNTLSKRGTNTNDAWAGHVMSGGVVTYIVDHFSDTPAYIRPNPKSDDEHAYELTREHVIRGLQLLARSKEYCHHFNDIMRGYHGRDHGGCPHSIRVVWGSGLLMTDEEKLTCLQRLAKRWKGEVIVIDDYNEYMEVTREYQAPFNAYVAAKWKKRQVYAWRPRLDLPTVIHEMGHIFATPHHPDSPRCDELQWLGWEYVLARQLRLVGDWKVFAYNYHLGKFWHDMDLGELDAADFKRVMIKAMTIAKNKGVLVNGKPVVHPKRRI